MIELFPLHAVIGLSEIEKKGKRESCLLKMMVMSLQGEFEKEIELIYSFLFEFLNFRNIYFSSLSPTIMAQHINVNFLYTNFHADVCFNFYLGMYV